MAVREGPSQGLRSMRGPTGNASPVGPHVFLGGPRPQLATLPRAGYAAGPQPFRARSRPMFSVATTRSLGFLAAVLVAAAAAAPPPLVAQRPKRKAPPASAISPRADSTRSAPAGDPALRALHWRSEEHTLNSSHTVISYAV